MGKGLIVVIVLVLIVLVCSVSTSACKNTLVTKNEAVKAAWSQVDIVLQRRADLIPNLVETVKGICGAGANRLWRYRERARRDCSRQERPLTKLRPTINWMERSAACSPSRRIIRS